MTPVDLSTFCQNFVSGSVKLDRISWNSGNEPILLPFYGNTNSLSDLHFILGQDANYQHDVECNRSTSGFTYGRMITTECGGAAVPSGQLGNSFETVVDLLPEGLEDQLKNDCIETQIQQATADAQVLYNQVIEDLWSQFYNKMKSCLDVVEDFKMTYTLKEYQYTLYYYDWWGTWFKLFRLKVLLLSTKLRLIIVYYRVIHLHSPPTIWKHAMCITG